MMKSSNPMRARPDLRVLVYTLPDHIGLDHVITKPIDLLELLRVSNSFKAHM